MANIKVIFMEHPQEQTLHAYVDQELDRQKEEALCAHLSRCPQCRGKVDELTLLFDELKHLPSPRPNPELTTRILITRQHERWKNFISFDLFAFLFGRIGLTAVAVGLLAGILLGISVNSTWTKPPSPLESSYAITGPGDLYLDYLISDNGDIL